MNLIDKTVFISYRRTNVPWALAIWQNLTHHGYDVFFDFSGIPSGDFEDVILGNITSRAHFLVLLTPSALERCNDANDWLRREIETALDSKRNMVPLMLEGFDFGTPKIASQLTGSLAPLCRYNALSIPPDYFLEAMERLRTRFLNVHLDAVPHPPSAVAKEAATEQKVAAEAAPSVPTEDLTAQQWFERGYEATDPEEQIRFYTQAIRLKPDYDEAFYNRGTVRGHRGDLDGALRDLGEAIHLKSDDSQAFCNRGNARSLKGDLDGALQDYTEAIRLQPDYAIALYNLGSLRGSNGDLDGALRDLTEAIRLDPGYVNAFCNRGNVRNLKGDLNGALTDYTKAIHLQPDLVKALNNRSIIRRALGDTAGADEDYAEALRLGYKPES